MLDSVRLGPDADAKVFEPGRLWDLWEMMNFALREYDIAVGTVQIFALHNPFAGGESPYFSRAECKAIAEQLKPQADVFRRLQMDGAADQVDAIVSSLRGSIPAPPKTDLETRCNVLLQTIHKAARTTRFYFYPKAKSDRLDAFDKDWKQVIEKFPAASQEFRRAVDLWALDHSTAAVHTAMRGAELGLRVLAKERKVTFSSKPTDWGTWGNLIDALDAEVLAIKKKGNGPQKDAALKFYTTAVSHMRHLNHTRDMVNHVRQEFDEHEAASVIGHVKDILMMLATRLSENSKQSIRRGF